jgi:hypothetical protein
MVVCGESNGYLWYKKRPKRVSRRLDGRFRVVGGGEKGVWGILRCSFVLFSSLAIDPETS